MDQNKTQNQEILTASQGTGYLIVHVTTAGTAIPLAGAKVNIQTYARENVSDPQTRGDTIASLITGTDGNTLRLPLSAPLKILSEAPNHETPYSLYQTEVTLEGYASQVYSGIPIFDGITSIQPIILIPLPENGEQNLPRPDSTRYFEGGIANLS